MSSPPSGNPVYAPEMDPPPSKILDPPLLSEWGESRGPHLMLQSKCPGLLVLVAGEFLPAVADQCYNESGHYDDDDRENDDEPERHGDVTKETAGGGWLGGVGM